MIRKVGFLGVVIITVAFAFTHTFADEKKQPSTPNAAAQAKAVFEAKFNDYKAAIRDIEKLQGEFQTADAATREKLNTTMTAQVSRAQSLVNAMVEAAEAAYRAAPNADPQIKDLLIAVV